eukprot:2531703-Rhodomonas_salina.1
MCIRDSLPPSLHSSPLLSCKAQHTHTALASLLVFLLRLAFTPQLCTIDPQPATLKESNRQPPSPEPSTAQPRNTQPLNSRRLNTELVTARAGHRNEQLVVQCKQCRAFQSVAASSNELFRDDAGTDDDDEEEEAEEGDDDGEGDEEEDGDDGDDDDDDDDDGDGDCSDDEEGGDDETEGDGCGGSVCQSNAEERAHAGPDWRSHCGGDEGVDHGIACGSAGADGGNGDHNTWCASILAAAAAAGRYNANASALNIPPPSLLPLPAPILSGPNSGSSSNHLRAGDPREGEVGLQGLRRPSALK